jgi:hypothetical protein
VAKELSEQFKDEMLRFQKVLQLHIETMMREIFIETYTDTRKQMINSLKEIELSTGKSMVPGMSFAGEFDALKANAVEILRQKQDNIKPEILMNR